MDATATRTKRRRKPATAGEKQGKRQPLPCYEFRSDWDRQLNQELDAGTREFPDRTPYFYRNLALKFLRSSRQFEWFPGQRDTYHDLAKLYLRLFHDQTERWSKILTGKVKWDGICGLINAGGLIQ